MKKITTILFIILCSITYSQSKDQSDIGKEGTLFFKDGNQKKGIIEFKKNNIYFRENKDSEEKVYTFNDVYKLSINKDNGEIDDYEYKLVIEEPKTKVYLFKVLIKGKVSLYSKSYQAFNSFYDSTGGNSPFGGYGGNIIEHYLSKENDLYATKIILNNIRNNHFKLNIAPVFFGDCEYLMSMVKRNVIEKNDFEGVVNYYNSGTKCNQ
mgnify:CR=1 FL=1